MVHVLIVDDDDDTRATLRWALEDSGHDVSEAPDGTAALDALRASPYPLVVVLDIVMPDADGITVLHHVREDSQLASRHCYLMVTAMPTGGLRLPEELKRLLALPVISKPFDLDTFLSAVEQVADRLAST